MKIKLLVVGPLLTNCYLLISGGEFLIVDPGGGVNPVRNRISNGVKEILKEINQTKAKPKYILNTHCHWDHTLGNKAIKKITKAEILTNLKEGDEIKAGDTILKVIHTSGHTKESICLIGDDFIFTGDTLFKDGHGRTDLPGGSQEDLEKSLERLKKILKPGMTVYPGHGEIFKIK